TVDGGGGIVRLGADQRNGTRWSVALALGLRQGEALGLRWRHVDLDAGILTIRWQLQRLPWRHGCSDPHACGKTTTATTARVAAPGTPALARNEPAAGSTSPG